MALAKVAPRTYTVSGGGKLAKAVAELGGEGIMKCYQCGVCTAICPLSEVSPSNFRKTIKYLQLGLEPKVLSDPTPWLCFHCGECKQTCPRDANPSEIMAAVRRYATSRYDVTGLSGSIYRSNVVEILGLVLLAVVLLIPIVLFHGPIVLDHVDLFALLPIEPIDRIGMIIGGAIAVVVLANLVNMANMMGESHASANPKGGRVSRFLSTLTKEVAVQRRFGLCESKTRRIAHLALFWGFIGLAASTTLVFAIDIFGLTLDRMVPKTLGVMSGIALIYGSVYYIYKRVRKDEEAMAFSHFTDWTFLILLFLAGITGFLVDTTEFFSLPAATYIVFVAHLIVVFDLLVMAPFTKFAHALYRPFVLYFTNLGAGELRGEE